MKYVTGGLVENWSALFGSDSGMSPVSRGFKEFKELFIEFDPEQRFCEIYEMRLKYNTHGDAEFGHALFCLAPINEDKFSWVGYRK